MAAVGSVRGVARTEAAREPDEAMARYAAGDDQAFGDVYDGVAPQLEPLPGSDGWLARLPPAKPPAET